MQRHSDRKAYFERRQRGNFQWSGRIGDRDGVASQSQHGGRDAVSSDPGTRSIPGSPSPAGPPVEQRTVHDLAYSANQDDGPVPLGEHHKGSMGVYMAHKMAKLRTQVDRGVTRLQGPDGSLFKGVVAHFNGHFPVPLPTLRELLISRGGVVEAYNTSVCTHMICEVLPAAKIRELRKLRHPMPVVRSAWIKDSVSAGRKLPVADYMVEGIYAQKRTLAASFAGAASQKTAVQPPAKSVEGVGARGSGSSSGNTNSSQGRTPAGGFPEAHLSHPQSTSPYGSPGPNAAAADQRMALSSPKFATDTRRGATAAADRGAGEQPQRQRPEAAYEGTAIRFAMEGSSEAGKKGSAVLMSPSNIGGGGRHLGGPGPADQGVFEAPSTGVGHHHELTEVVSRAAGWSVDGGMAEPNDDNDAGELEGDKGGDVRKQPLFAAGERDGGGGSDGASGAGGGRSNGSGFIPSEPFIPPPFELPDMGAAGEGGRSTKDDPAFMKTFFQNSRLHYIGVGRAHAVKVVNAGLAARCLPGAAQPIFGGDLGRGESRVILHVDMDCFFVSVLVRNRPELRGKPVAVAHNASNAKGAGSSEISSCNYPARAKGLRAGMFMMQAKKLCPELVVLRYDFDAYTEVSEKMYGIFLRYAPVVMAVSCDEAFLELAEGTDAMEAATRIRRSISEETGCSASAGGSNNMLLARMATKEAKPNGQFWLPPETAMHHMGPLPVQDLPGVGWKLGKRLNEEGLKVCSDLWSLSVNHMQKGLSLGEKTGRALWEACRGIDERPVQAPPDRKSIGAEVNYGVRFDTQEQTDLFLSELAVELSKRMAAEEVLGQALTLKIMKQRDGVGAPRKYLGHGICDARSKLLNLRRATADAGILKSHALQLLRASKVPPGKIRGIGLQMTRLSPANGGGGGDEDGVVAEGGKIGSLGSLHEWLVKPSGEEKGSDFAEPPTAGAISTKSKAVNPTKKARETAWDLVQVSHSLILQRAPGNGASTPAVRGAHVVSSGSPSRSGQQALAREMAPDMDPSESQAGDTAVSRRQNMVVLDDMTAAAASDGPPRHEKRPRGEGGDDGRTAPLDAPPPPHHSCNTPSVPIGAAATFTHPTVPTEFPRLAGGVQGVFSAADAAGASTPTAIVGPPSGRVDQVGPAADRSKAIVDVHAQRVRKVARTAAATDAPSTPRVGVGTTPSRSQAAVRESQREQGVVGAAGGFRDEQGGTSLSSTPSSEARRMRVPDTPEWLSPPTPADHVVGTPSTGAAGSPSMSQVTFSQIDKSVLGALPPDLRREVMSQVEARKRRRQSGVKNNSPSFVAAMPCSPGAAHRGEGQHSVLGGDAVVDIGSTGASVRNGSSSAGDGSRAGESAGDARTTEAIREGFDLVAREAPAKVQQVSLDSLWTLHKLRREGNDDPGGAPSVFDRESLRALPLGLGLHYASLNEDQRAQIARRYAQQASSVAHSAQDESLAQGPASTAVEVPERGVHHPLNPTFVFSGAVDAIDSSLPSRPPPPPPQPVHSPEDEDFRQPVRHGSPRQAEKRLLESSPRSKELQRLSLSQVDSDVLDCLPPEVLDEVLRAIASNARDSRACAAGSRAAADRSEVMFARSDCISSDGVDVEDGPLNDADVGLVDEDGVVDVCSPSLPGPPSSPHEGEHAKEGEDEERYDGAFEVVSGANGSVFEVESGGALRGALRRWIGGAVRSPSQWHLELLYRYLEGLVKGGRLDETATLLRCLGRLSTKADQDWRSAAPSGAEKGGGEWIKGYHAVLGCVQELVRQRTGGATLALAF